MRRTVQATGHTGVDDLVRALGIDGLSKSVVSRICAELHTAVGAFRARARSPVTIRTCGSKRRTTRCASVAV